MSERKDICENCSLWDELPSSKRGDRPRRGICHRYAPAPMDSTWQWPITNVHDWCGDFQHKVIEKAILEVLAEAELSGDETAAKALRDLLRERVGL